MSATLPFTKGCEQLAASEIKEARKVARIHVERTIVKNTLFCPSKFFFQSWRLSWCLPFFAGILCPLFSFVSVCTSKHATGLT